MSFLAAAVVAFAEVILYIIWESRRNAPLRMKESGHRKRVADKKDDGPAEVDSTIADEPSVGEGMTRRRINSGSKSGETNYGE